MVVHKEEKEEVEGKVKEEGEKKGRKGGGRRGESQIRGKEEKEEGNYY